MSADKFNAFKQAEKEANNSQKVKKPLAIPKVKKETKEQMSIVLTPTNKKKLREMAESVNMSASELIAYWIENQE